jgi:hypothetical protein
VSFIYALGGELGMGRSEVDGYCEGQFDAGPEMLTRKEASAVIDALQRERVKDVAPADDGKDELVSVGVSKKSAAPPEDDDDLSFD